MILDRFNLYFVLTIGFASIVAAGDVAPSLAMPISQPGPAAQLAASQGCQQDIEAMFQHATLGRSRVVVTFNGSQTSLMPLYESPYVAGFDVTLFPIDRTEFILTLQVRPISVDAPSVRILATQLCSLAHQGGARFNGVMLYDGNEMTAAQMAEPGR